MIGAKAKPAGNSRVAESLTPERYEGFDGHYIGGSRRPGRIGTKAIDGDPYSGEVQAGMTHVNGLSVDDAPTGPFGGEKNSGVGRLGGEWMIRELTTDH